MQPQEQRLFALAPSDHYERPDLLSADAEWHRIIAAVCPPSWSTSRHDIWFNVAASDQVLPPHGFKIHLSTIQEQADELLAVAAGVCVAEGASFKFAANRAFLTLLNSKEYDRGSAGKFLTIYPTDNQHFDSLVRTLYGRVRGLFVGPYILSDRRYRDCPVLHYRYGGLRAGTRLQVDGVRVPDPMIGPGAVVEQDERMPYFKLPTWVRDPYGGEDEVPVPEEPVLGGRFLVTGMVRDANRGNIYAATDILDGGEVVLKEARPFVSRIEAGGRVYEYADLLEHEQRVLHTLDGLPIVPRPVALFSEWEHTYSSLSRLPGETLLQHMADSRQLLLPYIDRPGMLDTFRSEFRVISVSLIDAVKEIHRAGVVIGDLSAGNVLVDEDPRAVRLIDFECSRIVGDTDSPVTIGPRWLTPGFGKPGRREEDVLTFEHDWYGVGMVLFNWVCFIHAFADFDPDACDRLLEAVGAVGVPPLIIRGIRCLLANSDPDGARECFGQA